MNTRMNAKLDTWKATTLLRKHETLNGWFTKMHVYEYIMIVCLCTILRLFLTGIPKLLQSFCGTTNSIGDDLGSHLRVMTGVFLLLLLLSSSSSSSCYCCWAWLLHRIFPAEEVGRGGGGVRKRWCQRCCWRRRQDHRQTTHQIRHLQP